MTNLKIIAAAAAFLASLGAMPAAMASNGINALIAVTQMKVNNANDEALEGADKQRELVQQKKDARRAAKPKSNGEASQPQEAQAKKQ